MKILLGGVPFGCDNIGDEAILASVIGVFRRICPPAELVVCTGDREGTERTFGLKTARDPRLMTVSRQMLHAATLELPDPVRRGKESIRAHSPLPADFRQCLKTFGMGK